MRIESAHWNVSKKSGDKSRFFREMRKYMDVMQTVAGKEHTNEQTHRVEKPHKKF